MTCVAVIITLLLAACSSQGPETAATPTASAKPTAPVYDITRNAPAGYDEWALSGSSEVVPAMQPAARLFGLSGIYAGKHGYGRAPYVGVATLETQCMLGFMNMATPAKSDDMGLVVLSRYNPDLMIVVPSISAGSMKELIDSYRAMCRGEAPVPAAQRPTSVTTT